MQQSQQQFSFQDITYEALSPLPEGTDFASMPQRLISILTSNQWEQQLQALTFIRQLNKQFPTQVFNVLQNFQLGLTSTLSSSPKVSKYAIQTMAELLQNACQCEFIGFGFSKFIEALLSKTINEQKSLSLLAQNLLSQILQSQYSDSYDNFINSLIELIYTNKNVNAAENAIKALAHIIASKGLQGLQSLQMENLGKLIQFIAKLTQAKRSTFQNFAGQIANYLLQLTGELVLSNLMTNFLQEEDQQNMLKAINSAKTKGSQNPGKALSMQLRQHIREVKKSHIVNNNMKEIFGEKQQPLQEINMSNFQNMQNFYDIQSQQQFQYNGMEKPYQQQIQQNMQNMQIGQQFNMQMDMQMNQQFKN